MGEVPNKIVEKNIDDIMKKREKDLEERGALSTYWDPPKGECEIEFELPSTVKTRVNQWGKEQGLIYVKSCKTFRGSMDYRPEKEWWVTILSPVFQAMYERRDEGKAHISRAGDGINKTIEVLND